MAERYGSFHTSPVTRRPARWTGSGPRDEAACMPSLAFPTSIAVGSGGDGAAGSLRKVSRSGLRRERRRGRQHRHLYSAIPTTAALHARLLRAGRSHLALLSPEYLRRSVSACRLCIAAKEAAPAND